MSAQENDAPMIFFNIGWMAHYQGLNDDDKIKGNFGYIKENNSGHEQFNFLPTNGWLYGYAPIRWLEGADAPNKININKIGANSDDDVLKGADVIFFSRNPNEDNSYIVGWYRNAEIFREARPLEGRKIDGIDFYYSAKTRAKYGVCVPKSKRIFVIPSSKKETGGYGESAIWYADKIPGFKDRVRKYIEDYGHPHARIPKNMDVDAKLLVEQTAVKTVTQYYEDLDYEVQSVEDDNVGWDLTATHKNNGTELFIEVKGLSGECVSVQLTPNEYKTMKNKHNKYILAVCTKTLTKPELHIYTISRQEKDEFYAIDDDGNILEFVEYTSAIAQPKE